MASRELYFGVQILTVIVSAAVSIGGSYWITYERIEKPKILIEQQKNDVSALQILQEFRPTGKVSCHTEEIAPAFSWKVVCRGKNTGKYLTKFQIQDITVSVSGDHKEIAYHEGAGGFSLVEPTRGVAVFYSPEKALSFQR